MAATFKDYREPSMLAVPGDEIPREKRWW